MRKKLGVVLTAFLLLTARSYALEKIPASPELRIHVTPDVIQVVRFPNPVVAAFVDSSKGIQVQAQGNNLLIKWNPYYKKPAVIAVSTQDDEGRTHDYSIVAIPDRRQPEVVEVYVPEERENRKRAAYFERSMPYEELLVNLTRQFMAGTYPDYYTVKRERKLLGDFAEIQVWLTEVGIGDRFEVLKGYVKNLLNRPIHIDETTLSFLKKLYDVRSISVRHHDLRPGEITDFVVVIGRR